MATKIKTKSNMRLFDGRKAVDLWGDDLTGWNVTSGDGTPTPDSDYYKLIPTLYRAVQLRAYSVSTMPFEILKGKSIYDSSADWQNKVGFLPNPTIILQLVESALVMAGKAYLFKEKSAAATKKLRYHLPNSVSPIISKTTGEIEYFNRPVNGVDKHFKPEDYIYFWPPDPYVEVGPAINYPAKAAANACGVLMNMDVFADEFFGRGAIRAMLLTVKGMPNEAERLKLVEWWKRVVGGIKNAFGAQVINADAVTPVVVGEGMKELENVTLGQEKREDISIAIGIPMSILFANAANYATSQQDELNYLTKTIIPECEFIASVLNEQLFTPLGLHMNFLPETLDAMQEDEAARAQALGSLVTALVDPIAEHAMTILGYEVDDATMAALKKLWAEKQKRADDMAEKLAQKPEPPVVPPGDTTPTEEGQEEDKQPFDVVTGKGMLDILVWKKKSINQLSKGLNITEPFISEHIPKPINELIASRLKMATDRKDIYAAFVLDGVTTHTPAQPAQPDFSDLIGVLREGIKAFSYEPAAPPQPPTFNIIMPETKTTPIAITNIIPEQKSPDVTINNVIPEQKSPDVNVTNIVPEQKPPDVKITNIIPDQKPPIVNIQQPERRDGEIIDELRKAVKANDAEEN